MKNRKIFNLKNLLLVPLAGLIIGFSSFTKDDNDDFELIKNLEIFHTLMRDIRILYVDEVSSGELIKNAMDEMLKKLDPYTVYYPESLVEDVMFINTGEYAGIGAEIVKQDGDYQIVEIFKDSPADKAGLLIGDKILKINDKDIKNKTNDEIGMLMKGEPGTMATFTIERYSKVSNYNVKRAMVKENSVTYYGKISDKTGYICLSSFTENCSKEVKSAFLKLKNEQKIENLILDLRNNPGGLLIEAVNIVNLFVNKGENIVEMKGRVEQWNKAFKAENSPIDTKMPIVVLVNGQSASASEIVSGALQDLDRAVIIGEKTYGKGLVQTTKDMVYNSKLKITTAKYYIPSGRCIQKLDYSHKDSTGKATQIAETQNRTFKTKNGRLVKDAGGILPDITVNSDTLSLIAENLIAKNIIFNYATKYKQNHAEIAQPDKFELSDAEMSDFKIFAGNKLFDYQSESDAILEELQEAISREYSDANIKTNITNIKTSLEKQKQQEFQKYQNQIKTAISSEIITRYYYKEGVLKYNLRHDKFVEQAKNVLNDANLYKKVFNN